MANFPGRFVVDDLARTTIAELAPVIVILSDCIAQTLKADPMPPEQTIKASHRLADALSRTQEIVNRLEGREN